jgi:hypothetical protein
MPARLVPAVQAVLYTCPTCRTELAYTTGFQPTAQGQSMTHERITASLAGYEGAGTLVVRFAIPSGFQDLDAPIPGEPYEGINMTSYLPDTSEGREVLRLLELGWKRRLLFKIGFNPNTKRMNM